MSRSQPQYSQTQSQMQSPDDVVARPSTIYTSGSHRPSLSAGSSARSHSPTSLPTHRNQGSGDFLSIPPAIYRTDSRPSISSAGSSVGSASPMSPSSEPDGYSNTSYDDHTAAESHTEDIGEIKIELEISPDNDVIIMDAITERLQEHVQRSPWTSADEIRYPINLEAETLGRKGAWDVVYERRRKDDQAKCAIWKEEIDKLMVFAGLFAATVVAFIIVSYQLLLPTPDDMMKSLHDMAISFAAQYFPNGTCTLKADAPLSSSPNAFQPSASVLRMNASWFLSMTLAISTVLIGTICLQWIREYQRDTRLGPKQAFAVMQMRHDGFEDWKIPLICSLLPLSLQASLLLFFWGLLEFLWTLNTAVTLIISVIIAIVVFFMIATIVAPAMQCIIIDSHSLHKYEQCAFKSPQARIFSVAAFTVAIFIIRALRSWSNDSEYMRNKEAFLNNMLAAKGWDWVSFDNHWLKAHDPEVIDSHYVPRALGWIGSNFVHDREAIFALYRLLRTARPSDATKVIRIISEESDCVTLDNEGQEALLSDLQAAHFWHKMVLKNPELHDAVLSHRAELFIRIVNCTEYREDIVRKWRSLNPFTKPADYALMDKKLAIQFIMAFIRWLEGSCFPEDLWRVIKHVVPRFAKETEDGSSHLAEEMTRLKRELERLWRKNQFQDLQEYLEQCDFRHEESRDCRDFLRSLDFSE